MAKKGFNDFNNLLSAYHRNEPPVPLEREHSEHVSSGNVSQKCSEKGFFDKSVDKNSVIENALSEERQATGLANDDVSPLDDDDRGEEHCVACEFEDLALRVRPLLAEGICHRLNNGLS